MKYVSAGKQLIHRLPSVLVSAEQSDSKGKKITQEEKGQGGEIKRQLKFKLDH